MYLFFFLVQLVFAFPPNLQQEFYQRQQGKKGTVLLVISPGWEKFQYEELLEKLWKSGFSIWTLEFTLPNQNIQKMQGLIQESLQMLPKKTAIWAHGSAGTIVAHGLEKNKITPAAVVLTGTPLVFRCSKAFRTYLNMESSIANSTELLFGPFRPQPVATTWTKNLQSWCARQKQIDVSQVATPMWFASSGMDYFAPPEQTRPMIGDKNFTRISPLSFDFREPNHHQLIRHERMMRSGIKWLRQTLRESE